MIIIGGWWVHGGHCTFIYIWTFVCLHMSEHKEKWKNFEFIQKYRTMWLIPLWFVYNPHMLQAKLLNVALKYYNKEKNANGWILKNSTSASSYNFQIQVKGKHFKRKALKTYIFQGITCKFKKLILSFRHSQNSSSLKNPADHSIFHILFYDLITHIFNRLSIY